MKEYRPSTAVKQNAACLELLQVKYFIIGCILRLNLCTVSLAKKKDVRKESNFFY